MALPLAANTTADLYRSGRAPPAAPDVSAVPIYLAADFTRRMETGEGEIAAMRYTHTLLCDIATDIRDAFAQWTGTFVGDSVWVPNKNGTKFVVRKVDRCAQGSATEHKKAYLDRATPPWPTNNL